VKALGNQQSAENLSVGAPLDQGG